MLLPVILFASLAVAQQTPPSGADPRATPAPVQAASATAPPAATPQPPSEIAQVCRTEAVTGSRFGRRVCRNAIQTEEDRAASREMLRQMQGARTPPSG